MVDFIGTESSSNGDKSRWKRAMDKTKERLRTLWPSSEKLPDREEE